MQKEKKVSAETRIDFRAALSFESVVFAFVFENGKWWNGIDPDVLVLYKARHHQMRVLWRGVGMFCPPSFHAQVRYILGHLGHWRHDPFPGMVGVQRLLLEDRTGRLHRMRMKGRSLDNSWMSTLNSFNNRELKHPKLLALELINEPNKNH